MWTAGTGTGPAVRSSRQLDVLADGAEDLADRRAQEEQGEDRHDGDEGEDQRVLRETLAFLVAIEQSNKCGKHGGPVPPFPRDPPNRLMHPPMRESDGRRRSRRPCGTLDGGLGSVN